MGREITNPVRRHYIYDVFDDTSRCQLDDCNKVVKGNHAANLQRHLRRWHVKAYHQLMVDKQQIQEQLAVADDRFRVDSQIGEVPQQVPPPPTKQVPPPQQPPPLQQLPGQVHRRPLAPKPRPQTPPPPPPPPEVCLRWNSYHSNMQATFPQLLHNQQFVDVTLACEGRSIKCHKMMLSACSTYFDQLLTQNPCQHPIVLMKDLKFWEIEALVQFMYRGEVNVGQDKLPSLLAAAEALQIKGLAGPASSPSAPGSHDGDSMPYDNDYLDAEHHSPPATSSGHPYTHRARKRRTVATMPVYQPPLPPIISPPRSARLLQRVNLAALPSTSRQSLPSHLEPPLRKRKVELSPAKVVEALREIKLEPLDIQDEDSCSQDAAPPLPPPDTDHFQPLRRIKLPVLAAFHSVSTPPSPPPPTQTTTPASTNHNATDNKDEQKADAKDDPDTLHEPPDAAPEEPCPSPEVAMHEEDDDDDEDDDDEDDDEDDSTDPLIHPEVVMTYDPIGDD